jgi:transglutaminase superfamily protein
MSFLFLTAYWNLIRFHSYVALGDFRALYERVHECPLRSRTLAPDVTERVCFAVDMACIWYWKEVLCLERSAATAWMLKRYGVPAQLVLGAQQMPFKAHAWVEVRGRIVNDKPYMQEIYAVLDRC